MTSHRSAALLAVLAVCSLAAPDTGAAAPARAAPPPGDPRRGAVLYESRCTACHALDANRVGPAHRGVFGRRAGQAAGFEYTEALRTSGLTWTAANLDLWLAAPTRLVRGTAMGFRLAAPQDRADIIAYLASPAVTPPARRR